MAWEDRSGRIDKDGPKLVRDQVADDIAADIEAGTLRAGARLPSEPELAEVYGVARITVRAAIAQLVERGLVVVVHGRGTFVAERQEQGEES